LQILQNDRRLSYSAWRVLFTHKNYSVHLHTLYIFLMWSRGFRRNWRSVNIDGCEWKLTKKEKYLNTSVCCYYSQL